MNLYNYIKKVITCATGKDKPCLITSASMYYNIANDFRTLSLPIIETDFKPWGNFILVGIILALAGKGAVKKEVAVGDPLQPKLKAQTN